MKTRILSIVALLLMAVTGAVAQTETLLADGSYYVKNGALSLYMAAGGSWGTQGIVNERGLDLIFTYNSGTKTYTIDSRLDNGGNNHFLNSGLYMDAPSFGWTVEGENSFTISANLDGVKKYLAVDQNNNLVYTEDGTAENAQWIIIPKADNENAVLAAGLEAMKAATAENGVDATFLIACPGFNRNDKRNAEAWTVEANRLEMGSGSSDGNGCAGSYNSTFTLSQTLSNAPAGVYTLTAQGFYKQNGSDNENLPYFFANDEKQTFKLLEDQVYNTTGAGPVFTQGKYTIDPITVVVAEDGALTIGAKLETNTQLWSCWDNFKLTYYGPQSEKPEDMYDLKLADGSEAHGTVAFTVDGVATEKAKKDDVVTVSVTPNEGYSAKDVTVRAYTGWESAGARRMNRAGENPEMIKDITVTPGENNTWTFTMPESDVTVEVTYAVVDKTALNTAITEAETYYNTIKDDHAEAAAALKTAIDNAKTMQEKGDATQEEVNNALSALTTAKTTAEDAVLTETKTALNNDITAAETYYNSIKDDHTAAANTLKEAIDAAKGVKDNADATKEQVDAAIAALAGAKTTAEQTVLTETKSALNTAIGEAETYYNSIKDSNPTAAATLLEAINAAKAVKDNTDATQEQVDAAIAALACAKTTAEQTVLTETKDELNDDITEAEAYYNSIKDSNPAAAATLLDAINAAKTVKNNASATQTEIETAAETLTDALDAAKADDALKRIAITIPAKSYVTRFDADKRQIETAVAGVSLYTVTGVTDKQVTLSAALNVVAAEMPYLIYNDNDEEKTINLIVSSSDADNVTVAAEFKGTLVNKTFTDEDMEEADHYVLSNGHNFVWVKDAGTLAAGK